MRTWFHLVYQENEISEAIKKTAFAKQNKERQASKQKKKKKRDDVCYRI